MGNGGLQGVDRVLKDFHSLSGHHSVPDVCRDVDLELHLCLATLVKVGEVLGAF